MENVRDWHERMNGAGVFPLPFEKSSLQPKGSMILVM